MPLSIVPVYGALLALVYVALTIRVVRFRFQARVSLGTGGDRDLERRIRAHGNFAEYVPLSLLLIAFVETQGQPAWLIHLLCVLLVAGRAAHAYALSAGSRRLRMAGMAATFTVLVIAASALLRGALLVG